MHPAERTEFAVMEATDRLHDGMCVIITNGDDGNIAGISGYDPKDIWSRDFITKFVERRVR